LNLRNKRPISAKPFIKWQKTPATPAPKFLLNQALSLVIGNKIPRVQIANFRTQNETSRRYDAISFEGKAGGKYGPIDFDLLDSKDKHIYILTDTISF
jgi:hypothetical protein